jgi:two-component system sensor histidine kinase BarA
MDMGLPDVDGVKTTAILKQNPKTAGIPVVALTAWVSEIWREKALRVGIIDYQLKPVSPHVLKQTIENFTKRGPADNRSFAFSPYRIIQ